MRSSPRDNRSAVPDSTTIGQSIHSSLPEHGVRLMPEPTSILTSSPIPSPLPPSSAHTSLEESLARLEQSDLPALQQWWQEVFGQAAPSRFGEEFLRRAIAYRLQEQVLGGLSRQAQLRLKAWRSGGQSASGSGATFTATTSVKPGTRFVREWQGLTHEVLALEGDAFLYRTKTYRSLTEVARTITGTHQSGPRFFGIGKYAPRKRQGSKDALLERLQTLSASKRKGSGGSGNG